MPGYIHNSQMMEWEDTYNKLKQVYDKTIARCTVNSVFSQSWYPFLIKSEHDNTNAPGDTMAEFCMNNHLNLQATAMCQSA